MYRKWKNYISWLILWWIIKCSILQFFPLCPVIDAEICFNYCKLKCYPCLSNEEDYLWCYIILLILSTINKKGKSQRDKVSHYERALFKDNGSAAGSRNLFSVPLFLYIFYKIHFSIVFSFFSLIVTILVFTFSTPVSL